MVQILRRSLTQSRPATPIPASHLTSPHPPEGSPPSLAPGEVTLIIDRLDQVDEMAISDVLALYAQTREMTHADAEKEAVLRSFGGVCSEPEAEWASHCLMSRPGRTHRHI